MSKKILLLLACIFSPILPSQIPEPKSQRLLWKLTLCETIFKQHVRLLKNTRINHKPLVVCFSGVPGMGIPEIAKVLEEKYKGVRISNDEIRAIIKNFASPLASQWIMQAYLMYFMLSYAAPNKFLILDSSIDRRYQALLPYLKLKGIPYIVVRLEAPYEQVIERLTAMEKVGQGTYLKFLDSWYADYDACGQSCPVTIVVQHDKNKPLELDALYAMIDEQLRE